MLTMTVMQHEREAVGGYSKEEVKDKGDVLSSLRQLHRTLQECHWRVQSVDHSLCAQNNKGLRDLQNQDGDDHSFQFQAGKDYHIQNQHGECHNLQDEAMEECSLKNDAGKNFTLQGEAEKKQNTEDKSKDINEQTEDDCIKDNSEEDHNHQNEIKEFEPENLSGQDTYHNEPAEEKESKQNVNRENESLPLQNEGDNFHDEFSDSKETLPTHPTKETDQNTMKDCTELHHPRPDLSIHNQRKKEASLLKNTKSTCDLHNAVSLHEQQFRGLVRQDGMDDDDLASVNSLDTVNASVDTQHIFRDLNESKTCAIPFMTNNHIHHQLLNQHLKCSDKVTKEVSQEHSSQPSDIRCRTSHKEKPSGSEVFHEGEIDLLENQKTNDSSLEGQKNKKTADYKRALGKVALVDTFPEVTQKMDIIWEALEKLQSHFLALHSSIVDSSSHRLNQELYKSLDKSDITLLKVNKDTEFSDLDEEHTRCEGEDGILHQSMSKQSSHKETVSRNPSQPVCHPSRNYTRSCTLQPPASEASLGDGIACRGTLFQGWQKGCLWIGLVLLLLLLLLFLASCLLLMLPIVSVSVRNPGGLPAF